jgi:outer membrane lipoprotein-sorting protein
LKRFQNGLALVVFAAGMLGCRVSRTKRIAPSQLPAPPQSASLAQLIAKINSQSAAVQSLTATVDLAPSTGSVYSGVIKQYHDVKGFLLARRPAYIRMAGQAPVVRTDIFDMASDGKHFSLYVPSENKFYVGETGLREKGGKSLENLRPQHVLDALLLQPVKPENKSYFLEEVDRGSEREYVIGVLAPPRPGPVNLRRKVWFDRSNLEISRVQLYGPEGRYLEDIQYSDYRDSGGVHYPAKIVIRRPEEDYSLTLTFLSAQFNQPVPVSKFTLKRPPDVQLIDLGAPEKTGESHGQ